nr:beta-ketoacyl-[acyl-carrier-protein] synthase family protein [Actinomycetota bacterium]
MTAATPTRVEKHRVAVTGLGMVCAIGNTTDEVWSAALAGRSGIGEIGTIGTGWLGTRYAGEVHDLDIDRFMEPAERDSVVRSAQLVIAAAHEALDQSKLDLEAYDPYRVGLVLGTCQGSLAELNPSRPHIIDAVHAACDSLGRHLGLRGPRTMVSTACSAGATAIGMARDRLWSGDVDVVVTGGADALTFFSLSGFAIMGALANGPCAPYSRSDGLSLGEGAAVLVLERYDDALRRGAPILAEIAGCGLSADAYHASAPDPSGRGAALAVRRALAQAGVTADEVGYVNGHGTATPANDGMERKAMEIIFGERARRVPWSSTKSMTGHTLGAAGAIETAMCVLATLHGAVPPTANFADPTAADFDFVPNEGRTVPVEVAVSNSYGFGGTNASVAVARPGRTPAPQTPAPNEPAVITGLGVVGPLGIGYEEWWEALA